MSTDRNLLFGILAVQMNFVTRDALIGAMNAWVLHKHKLLADVLAEHGQLDEGVRPLLEALVAKHVERHGGDAGKSLADLPAIESLKDTIATAVPDADVRQTLAPTRASGASAPGGARTESQPTIHEAGASGPRAVTEQPGYWRYRIVRPHAKGGLGEVFVAEDAELHREVALKEIQQRYAHDSRSRGRFVLEAEVTGGLEHPGIVPVYGLGAYPDGRPFYAMRLIRGDSLQEAVERFHTSGPADPGERNLAFRDLLKRFVDVCNAVAYAHSRGVLHRDIKPANVMLGPYGETLVVDWGLAKAMGRAPADPAAGERALQPASGSGAVETQAGSAIGTPAYMSPEQAAGRIDELGPAADVYSLGATLYTLLTGRAPFTGELGELLRQVKAGAFLPPRQVREHLPAALDAVVRKAMAKLPADRHPTAQALAADVEHYLADEPVSAYREPLPARVRRWGRKHRPLVAGLAALLVTAVVGLAIGLYRVNAEQQRVRHARDLAENRFRIALAAFNDMVHGVQQKLAVRPGTEDLRRELLTKARSGLEELLREEEQHGTADSILTASYLRMGEVQSALGDTGAALASYRAGNAMAQKLVDANPANAQAQHDLSISLNKLGELALQMGQPREAEQYYQRALVVVQQESDANPADAEAQRHVGIALANLSAVTLRLGQAQDAFDYGRRALAIRQKLADEAPADALAQYDLSDALTELGDAALKLGDPKGALAYYQRTLDIDRQQADAHPKDTRSQVYLSIACNRMGNLALRLGRLGAAWDHYQHGLAVCQKLVDDDPRDATLQRQLGVAFTKLGDVTVALGHAGEALDYFHRSREISRRLAEADPRNAEAHHDLVASYYKIGSVHQRQFAFPAAQDAFQKGLDVIARFSQPDVFAGDARILTGLVAGCRGAPQVVADPAAAGRLPAAERAPALSLALSALLDQKDLAKALRAADLLAESAAEGVQVYDAACGYARGAGLADKTDEKEKYAGRAVELLKEAAARGYKDAAHMKQDDDLDALRGRDDFKQFIQELEKKK